MELPTHCYSCGVYLKGGATEHKPDCEVLAIIQSVVEPLFYVFNETDGLLAHPEPMTREECDRWMIQFRLRFAKQGYYASVNGRIPIEELRLSRIPEAEL